MCVSDLQLRWLFGVNRGKSEEVGHCMLPYIRDQILELVNESLLVVLLQHTEADSSRTRPKLNRIAENTSYVCHGKTTSKLSLSSSEVWFFYVLPPLGENIEPIYSRIEITYPNTLGPVFSPHSALWKRSNENPGWDQGVLKRLDEQNNTICIQSRMHPRNRAKVVGN